jgi:hypothetical protein
MEILYFPKEAAITCIPFMINDTAVEEVRSFPKAMVSLTGVWHTVPDNHRMPRVPWGWPQAPVTADAVSVSLISATPRREANR